MMLTPAQIASAARKAGFRGTAVVLVVAIALGESSGNTDETHRNSDGSTDYGLLQINSIHTDLLASGDWRDPVANCRMGYVLYTRAGNSFRDWVVFKTGAYRDHLATANKAAASPDEPIPVGQSPAPDVANAGLHVPNPLAPVEGFAKFVTSPVTWFRSGWFALGALLLLIALVRLTAPTAMRAAKAAKKASPLIAEGLAA